MGRMEFPVSVLAALNTSDLSEAAQLAGQKAVTDYLTAKATPVAARTATQIALMDTTLNPKLGYNLDAWDGYPAARERLLRAAREANANLVTLTGDTHNAWAFQLAHGGEAAGVEFAGQSVTSPGFEGTLGKLPPTDLAASLVRHNPQLAWTDTSRRGYMAVELTPQRATCEWRFTPSVRQRSAELAGTHRMSATAGANRFDTN